MSSGNNNTSSGARDLADFSFEEETSSLSTQLRKAILKKHFMGMVKAFYMCSSKPNLLTEPNSSKGDTPMHLAARIGHNHFDSLVDLCVSEELKVEDILGAVNKAGDTPLHNFARASRYHSDLELPKCCQTIKMNEIKQVNSRNESLLYLAVRSGRTQLALLLLRNSDSKDSPSCDDRGPRDTTALHAAAECGHLEVLKELLKRPPKLSKELISKKSWEPVRLAIERNDIEVIKLLVKEYGSPMEAKNKEGQNILHVAIQLQKMETITHILKDDDFDDLINEKDKHGNTPLHVAAGTGNSQIVKLLLEDEDKVEKLSENENKELPVAVFCRSVSPTLTLNWKESFVLFKKAYPDFDIEKNLQQHKSTELEEKLLQLKQVYVSNVTVIATLICTVTFAAAFTVPGGFTGAGSPVLSTKAAFTAFTISNTIAMCFSLTVAFLSIYAPVKDVLSFLSYQRLTKRLLLLSFMAMIATFGTGSYVVLVEKRRRLAVFSLVTSCSAPLLILGVNREKVRLRAWLKKLVKLASYVVFFVLIPPPIVVVSRVGLRISLAEWLHLKEISKKVADVPESPIVPKDTESGLRQVKSW